MSVLSDYTARVQALLPDIEDEISDTTAAQNAVIASVRQYSRLKPRKLAADFSGDGSTYQWALPETYIADISRVTDVEYPQGEQQPVFIDIDKYTIYMDTDGDYFLQLVESVPSATETLRVYYTTDHSISATASTVPDRDFEAICQLAASFLSSSVAAYYGSTQRSTLESNAINYRTKADEWIAISKMFMNNFKLHMGMREKDVVRASTYVVYATKVT